MKGSPPSLFRRFRAAERLLLGDLGLDLHVQWMSILSTAAPTHAGMCVKSSFGRTTQL